MSPGNKRDWSALLYVPGEELVRSTIDGNDADWSESLSYVPPDSLIRAVLDAEPRQRPTLVLPATLMTHPARRGASNRARWTAALLAGLGFSPFSLAAAAVIHFAILIAIGPWIVTQASAVRSIRMPGSPAVVAPRLVYFLPAQGSSPPSTASRKQQRRAIAQPFDTTNSGRVTPLRPDSSGTPTRSRPDPNVEREVAGALSQELRFAGDGFELEREDRPKLELIVRVLSMWPELRVRVLGAASPPRETGPLPGMAEAEAMKRALVQAGIGPDRVDIGQMPEADRRCPEREPNCPAARRRVRTMMASPAAVRSP
jgi:hypothetical protein